MAETKTIQVSRANGPVTVSVVGKAVTLGKFIFSVQTEGGVKEVFRGQFGDAIPDVFMLPFNPGDLSNHPLYMIGNFAPGSPESTLIAYDIIFFQNNRIIGTFGRQLNIGDNYVQENAIFKFAVGA